MCTPAGAIRCAYATQDFYGEVSLFTRLLQVLANDMPAFSAMSLGFGVVLQFAAPRIGREACRRKLQNCREARTIASFKAKASAVSFHDSLHY